MKSLILLTLGTSLLAAPPAAAKTVAAKAKAPAELKWMDGPPGLPAGAQFAVIKGDPGKAGMFTIGIRMPANYSVPAHWHPMDEHVSVVSGKLAYGMSDRLNRTAAQGLNAGENVVMKAKMNHWVLTADGAQVEVSAMGPFKITYANPADDPRPKTK
jgi:quercetin dioxygenase-like cupin family protein